MSEVLSANPHSKSKAVGKAIGKSEGRVRTTKAWKANRAILNDKKAQESVRAMPLTKEMLAAIAGKGADPAEIVSARENDEQIHPDDNAAAEDPAIVERQYLEQADPRERAEFHKMSQTQRDATLTAWKLTGMG